MDQIIRPDNSVLLFKLESPEGVDASPTAATSPTYPVPITAMRSAMPSPPIN